MESNEEVIDPEHCEACRYNFVLNKLIPKYGLKKALEMWQKKSYKLKDLE